MKLSWDELLRRNGELLGLPTCVTAENRKFQELFQYVNNNGRQADVQSACRLQRTVQSFNWLVVLWHPHGTAVAPPEPHEILLIEKTLILLGLDRAKNEKGDPCTEDRPFN